jgi:hypothetical protein
MFASPDAISPRKKTSGIPVGFSPAALDVVAKAWLMCVCVLTTHKP